MIGTYSLAAVRKRSESSEPERAEMTDALSRFCLQRNHTKRVKILLVLLPYVVFLCSLLLFVVVLFERYGTSFYFATEPMVCPRSRITRVRLHERCCRNVVLTPVIEILWA